MDSLRNSGHVKLLKEEFVTNLEGSSMLEVSMQMTLIGVLVLLRRWISFNYSDGTETSVKKNDDKVVGRNNLMTYVATMLIDFVYIVLPYLLFLTVLSEWTYACAVMLIILLFVVAVRGSGSAYNDASRSLREHVSSCRVALMILTSLCIMAVDFKTFPRRFAKTETYGISLMDVGVGSFVFSSSVISRQARNIASREWMSGIKSTGPLILLGVGRLIFTRGVDYQVHVAEYGVHWNFFFTLAAVSFLTSIINVAPQYCGLLGSLILIGYQSCLLCGLNMYLLSTERKMDIISQNKEGIFSIFGYWGMYLVGVQLGNYILFESHSTAMKSSKSARTKIWILTFSFWLLTLFLDRYVERASRRMCNLAYVTAVLATNVQVFAIYLSSDFIPQSKISVLEEAFNRNLLGGFLLANVLTGVVNMLANTVLVSSGMALVILLAYALSLCIIVGLADFYGIKLKFW